MSAKFISLIVGGAMALSSVAATSVQAETRIYRHPGHQRNMQGNEAIAAALAGIAAMFIIGKTIERNKKESAPVIIDNGGGRHGHKAHRGGRGHGHGHGHKGHKRGHGHGHKAHRGGHGHGHGHGGHRRRAHGGHGGHAHWHRHGDMKHIHGHGPRHHRKRH